MCVHAGGRIRGLAEQEAISRCCELRRLLACGCRWNPVGLSGKRRDDEWELRLPFGGYLKGSRFFRTGKNPTLVLELSITPSTERQQS